MQTPSLLKLRAHSQLAGSLALIMVLAGIACDTAALAQSQTSAPDLARARSLFQDGLAMMRAERWGEAIGFLQQSLSIVERPSTLFNLGSCLVRLGRGQEAIVHLERYLQISDPTQNAQERIEATRLLDDARSARTRLVLLLDPPTATVEVDGVVQVGQGAERTLSLNPGEHRLRVQADGALTSAFVISLLSGESLRREVRLESAPTVLSVSVHPANAVLYLDGHQVASERPLSPSPGRHSLEIRAPGYVAVTRGVSLQPGQRLSVQLVAARQQTAVWTHPAFWIVTGLVVVGAGVAIPLAVVRVSDAPYTGNTNVIIQGFRDSRGWE